LRERGAGLDTSAKERPLVEAKFVVQFPQEKKGKRRMKMALDDKIYPIDNDKFKTFCEKGDDNKLLQRHMRNWSGKPGFFGTGPKKRARIPGSLVIVLGYEQTPGKRRLRWP
jgi:hypothetical protein